MTKNKNLLPQQPKKDLIYSEVFKFFSKYKAEHRIIDYIKLSHDICQHFKPKKLSLERIEEIIEEVLNGFENETVNIPRIIAKAIYDEMEK